MIRFYQHCALLALIPAIAFADSKKPGQNPDMIRFTEQANNDTLHGKFLSFSEKGFVTFKSTEAETPITFSTKKLHRITLSGGRPDTSLTPTSTVTLVNGDIIPGKIIRADTETVVLETEHLGDLSLPFDVIKTIAPTPHGGQLMYYGPLSPAGWEIIQATQTEKENEEESDKEKNDNEDAEEDTNWQYAAGAWYTGNKSKDSYLALKDSLQDRCKISFNLAWRGSLYCNIALHADFSPPLHEGQSSKRNNMAATVGKAYVVSLSSHNASLYECTFKEDGEPVTTRVTQNHVNMNLSREGEATIEFRLDRPNKVLMLYSNGNFICKWDLGDEYAGTGNSLGFRNLRHSNTELRLSDVLISKWNGMKDSAQSMQTKKRDVILLTNGVDRFSGTFNHIRDGKVSFQGTFDNNITIALADVQELHIASGKLRQYDDENDQDVHFYLQPFGRISGVPTADTNGRTKIQSSVVGDVSLDMKYVNLIDFSRQNSLLDFWNENF